jgi:hypothetical protein
MRISVFLPDNVDLTSIIHHIYAYTQYAILKFAQKIRPLQGFLEVQVSKTRGLVNHKEVRKDRKKDFCGRGIIVDLPQKSSFLFFGICRHFTTPFCHYVSESVSQLPDGVSGTLRYSC